MPSTRKYQILAEKRQARVRAKLRGTSERPRLNVFRSNKNTTLQVINDENGVTLAAVSSLKAGKTAQKTGTKTEVAIELANQLLEKLKTAKVQALVLDRGAYKYHGRIKAIAETLRAGKIEL